MSRLPARRARPPAGDGLLTQAPPNTGAGWYTLATGAWPGVHGSTNNTFHINGQPFANRTAAFDPGVLQAESIAQSAERGGLKVAQIEWAGGRNAHDQRARRSTSALPLGPRRRDQLHRPAGEPLFDDARSSRPSGSSSTIRPATPARRRSPARPDAGGRLDRRPASYSPAQEMRLRVLDVGVDKYGLNAYIYDSTNDGKTDYDRVLFSRTKSGADAVGTSRKGEWADVKVKIAGRRPRRQDRRACSSRSSSSTPDLSQRPAVPHVGHPRDRDLADLAGRARLHRRLRRVPRPEVPDLDRPPTSPSSRPASSARRPTSSRACTGRPATSRCSSTSSRRTSPTCCWSAARRRTSSSTSSSAWSRRSCPNGAAEPGLRRRRPRRQPDGRVAQREAFIRAAYEEADETLTLRPRADGQGPDDVRRLRPRLRAAVPGDRRQQAARRPRLLSQAADLQLPARRRARRSARPRPAGPAARCRSTSTSPAATRPAAGFQQVAAADEATRRSPRSRRRSSASTTRTTGPHDGQPEGWKVIDRAFTKAEARYIPNGAEQHGRHGPPDADRRPGRVLLPAVPVRRGDAGHADRAARSSSASTATCPDVQDLAAQHQHAGDVPGRRPGDRARARSTACARSTSRRRSRSCSASPSRSTARARCCSTSSRAATAYKPISIVGLNDFHGQLDPTTHRRSTASTRRVGGARATSRRCSTRSSRRCPARRCCWPAATTSAPRRRTRRCSRTCRRSTSRTRGASTPRRTATTSSTTASTRLLKHAGAGELPVPGDEHRRDGDRRGARRGCTPSMVFTVNGVKVGVIGAELQNTPELVSRRRDRGPDVPRRGAADQGRVGAPRAAGRKVQVVVIHQGTDDGREPDRQRRRRRRGTGPILGIADAAPGHDRRRDDRRPHAPHLEPDARQHPRHRGHQRRDELLGRSS